MTLKGKTAIVTGSTSGIGQGIATRLAGAGANIVVNGFGDAGEIEAYRASLEADFGVKAAYINENLMEAEGCADLVSKSIAAMGQVDILVNNAGIQYTERAESFPLDKWDAIIALNLSAVFWCSRAAIPGMLERGWGRIVNIASAHGLVASRKKAAYVAAKHGVIGLTKVMGLENANRGITVNAICPGWVLTPLVEKQIQDNADEAGTSFAEEKKKLLEKKQEMIEFSTPEDLGDLTVFLCTDSANTMTGTALSMDGGWTAR